MISLALLLLGFCMPVLWFPSYCMVCTKGIDPRSKAINIASAVMASVRACKRACVRARVHGWVGGWVVGWGPTRRACACVYVRARARPPFVLASAGVCFGGGGTE